MADNTIIAATIKVDAGAANTTVKEFNSNVKDAKSSLSEVGTVAGKAGKDVEGAGSAFGNLKEKLAGIPGPASAAAEGASKVNTVFKALATNPLVLVLTLIVGALTLLYKAFTNTFEGAEKVEQVFAGVKAAAQALFDDLGHIAKAIADFFTFDFSGAADEIAQVVSDVANAYTAMSNLTKQAQELHKEQLKNDLDAAKRAKDLAILREEAADDTVPIAKRKAALDKIKNDELVNGQIRIDNAKKIVDNQIAQWELEKDGALKHRDDINKILIGQEQLETAHQSELRRIDKQINLANKQDEAEKTAVAKEAADKRKKIAEEYAAYLKQLHTIQNENELLGIKDTYEKELRALQIKFTDEQKALEDNLKLKKINRDQFDKLNEALILNTQLKEDALTEKHNKDVADKEAAFQKELAGIQGKAAVDSIIDIHQRERIQLQITYEEKLQDAIKRYKDDAIKLQQIKEALQAQLKADQDKVDAKALKEQEKFGFQQSEAANQKIISAHNFEYDQKKAALDAQQQLVQDAFDQQIISEADYNSKTAALSQARRDIKDQEKQHSDTVVSGIAAGLETLAEIAGKQTAAGKALAIASTTIKTFQGAIAAFTGVVEQIPGPVGLVLGAVAAAGAVASGIAAVKKIVAVKIPGGHDASGSVPSGLPQTAAPVAPTQAGTKLDQSSLKGIGDATQGRTYVLDSDVASNREKNEKLNRAARLGGT